MPDERITIGGRDYDVACQPGEEQYLQSAARYLDTEAQQLVDQIGRLPEQRMLLMAGLMLADKTAGLEEQLRFAESRAAELEQTLADMQDRPAPEPERVEVPVIPNSVLETLEQMTARAEAIADETARRAHEDQD
ncbi:cell division protein ZapA [Palleronia marisminoris]|uniref:Cell division protein ZapA n=1 Tax=Palleronia marisminoris TaxID=315423 RepID=A0A1Y5RHJ9_9RHOB|nr:cell division protein ZapA [Palleronia marisminoris]SFG20035.1 cell division protein ZapA [Palleronia marisminoris]SLN17296.1 Cell division protein ZapA [Palleronia marisminoris]